MPSANEVPTIFVSPEDVVWQESTNPNYTVAFLGAPAVGTPSTVVPDLSISKDVYGQPDFAPATGGSPGCSRPSRTTRPTAPRSMATSSSLRTGRSSIDNGEVAGETVVEGVFGASSNVWPQGGPGYGAGADRTVLLRWFASQPDPVVKVGDFIADVTYERGPEPGLLPVLLQHHAPGRRAEPAEQGRMGQPAGAALLLVPGAEGEPGPVGPGHGDHFYRSMTVYVNRPLDAKTLLDGSGNPVYLNAALICPYVVNVIPQTFFVR